MIIDDIQAREFSFISEVSQAIAFDQKNSAAILAHIDEVRSYIKSQSWCSEVLDIWVGRGIPGVFMSFLVKIVPLKINVPVYHWVVCGDIPTAYLSIEGNTDAYRALASYILIMGAWVEAVRGRGDIGDCFPVNVPPTAEWADRLAGRLEFISACLTMDDDVPVDVKVYLQKMRSLGRS